MWLDRLVKLFLPREEHFFDLLERGSQCALKSSALLAAACDAQTPLEREDLERRMHDEEHAADRIIAEVYEALNKTFVTPLDRSDIFVLATNLENITDHIDATVGLMVVHAMDGVPPGSADLASKIKGACEELDVAVKCIRHLKDADKIQKSCKAVYALEHDGDMIFRTHIAAMFREETDAIRLLKNKEFLESLEAALDACDDVANALEMIVIKNA